MNWHLRFPPNRTTQNTVTSRTFEDEAWSKTCQSILRPRRLEKKFEKKISRVIHQKKKKILNLQASNPLCALNPVDLHTYHNGKISHTHKKNFFLLQKILTHDKFCKMYSAIVARSRKTTHRQFSSTHRQFSSNSDNDYGAVSIRSTETTLHWPTPLTKQKTKTIFFNEKKIQQLYCVI